MRVRFYTLGCKVNQYETQAMRAEFAAEGFEPVEAGEAEVLVVNSCTVTAMADRKTRQTVRRLRRENPTSVVVLTGCLPQATPTAAQGLWEADIVTGTQAHSTLPHRVKDFLTTRRRVVSVSAFSDHTAFEAMTVTRFDDSFQRAYLKVEDGCDRFCAYCVIPQARGPVRSRGVESIAREAETLTAGGYRELVLTGINLSRYGSDLGLRLSDAVRAASGAGWRVRLGSVEPDLISRAELEALAQIEGFCPHFHLALQSGCDATLARMNRRYTTAAYAKVVETIRKIFSNPSITTDLIAGFPGETDAEYAETCRFVETIGLLRAHVFEYSVRPGTAAAKMPDAVPASVKKARAQQLTAQCQAASARFAAAQIGGRARVLAEATGGGYTDNYLYVRLTEPCAVGEFVEVELVSACGADGVGEPIRRVNPPPTKGTETEGVQTMAVYRVYIEKKAAYAAEGERVSADLKSALGLSTLERVRILNRYDVSRVSAADFSAARMTVFGEPQVDVATDTLPASNARVLAVEFLPGQYDQRADSAAQCIQIQTQGERPLVRAARIYLLEGTLTDTEFDAVRHYLINPVDSREASLDKPETLEETYPVPPAVAILDGFCASDALELSALIDRYALAMDADDLRFCQEYFRSEGREPTLTELKVIDTYWSDHCRHTTFSTELIDVTIDAPDVRDAYDRYLALRRKLGRDSRPVTLMDLATIGAKALRAEGRLSALDESEEINACSVKISVDVDGVDEDWLLMFKNETHNHPTEIEPFGGAATCLGGAIRDPLSGRAYVYQAMRVTGAADPLTPVADTLPGKLPQRKLVTQAAAGYSSYGNQIGLATGLVHELYHPGYAAKRMEVGAVIGAVPAKNVRRECPAAGDVVLLLGGKTGRDGCGGATGSSKAHTTQSLEVCGAEVQKGNAPEERKLQRLMRNPEASKKIKRCNDFGAGGVAVAIGELADGLDIDLDAVPKKYEGLDGTELAISESQERLAVVVEAADAAEFITLARAENLLATPVAVVTANRRMQMRWHDVCIADLSRDFLDTNGARKFAYAHIPVPAAYPTGTESLPFPERMRRMAGDLNVCSQKGLCERFDSSIGAGTVLAPFGGRYQETPIQAMAAKIPVLHGETDTASVMAYSFSPNLSERNPYAGAALAVCISVARVIAAGGSRSRCWLSFQEYFERLRQDPIRWGKPLAALLGALDAQLALGCAAIGGKDSMSGSFETLDVPPTLISFAVSTAKASRVLSPEFKRPGSIVALISTAYDQNAVPDFGCVRQMLDDLEAQIASGNVRSAWVCGRNGVAEGLFKMSLGNRVGVRLNGTLTDRELFAPAPAAILVECDALWDGALALGRTVPEFVLDQCGIPVNLHEIFSIYASKLAPVYPYRLPTPRIAVPSFRDEAPVTRVSPAIHVARPRVLIPTFAGTNCEYDTARAFEREGALTSTLLVRNLSGSDIEWSVAEFERMIRESQIIAIPGGFSGGDEPDGSGKFITAFFRSPRIREAVTDLLENRDGLLLGICNGFQALVKLGLVPYGRIVDPDENAPTLTFNRIGRHQSKMVTTRVCSTRSPWMMYCTVGETHVLPVSHGEGRFVADPTLIARLAAAGQIATQYVDLDGNPTLDTEYNPNFSADAIEGITSPDGRVFAKMAHSERVGASVHKNIPGQKNQPLFRGAVHYFTK